MAGRCKRVQIRRLYWFDGFVKYNHLNKGISMIVIINGKKHTVTHPRLEAIIESMLSAEAAGVMFRDLLNLKDGDRSFKPIHFVTHCGREATDIHFQTDLHFKLEK
jgi:hypothetical protein